MELSNLQCWPTVQNRRGLQIAREFNLQRWPWTVHGEWPKFIWNTGSVIKSQRKQWNKVEYETANKSKENFAFFQQIRQKIYKNHQSKPIYTFYLTNFNFSDAVSHNQLVFCPKRLQTNKLYVFTLHFFIVS